MVLKSFKNHLYMLEYKRVKKFPQAKEIVIEISYFKYYAGFFSNGITKADTCLIAECEGY
jgi:hypothetical protein